MSRLILTTKGRTGPGQEIPAFQSAVDNNYAGRSIGFLVQIKIFTEKLQYSQTEAKTEIKQCWRQGLFE